MYVFLFFFSCFFLQMKHFQLVYLRRFANLRTVNLAGNPVCQDPDFKMFVAAHIPQLTYLDYRMIDDHFVSLCFLLFYYLPVLVPNHGFKCLRSLKYAILKLNSCFIIFVERSIVQKVLCCCGGNVG